MERRVETVHHIAGPVKKIYEGALSAVREAVEVESCAAYSVYDGSLELVLQHGNFEGAPGEPMKTKGSVYGYKEASIPVIVDGRTEGIISLRSRGILVDDDKRLLEAIAHMTAVALKNSGYGDRNPEERCRSIMENAVEGIYRSTVDGQIIDANQSLVKFFGYENMEELKRVGIFKTYKDPSEREKFIKEILKNGEVKNYEIEYIRKDGEEVVGNESAILVDGGMAIEGIIHDITGLRKAQKEAEFYDSLLRHDMWNKNQVVMGYLELLSDTELSVEQKNFLERAKLAIKSNMELMMDVKKLHLLKKSRETEEIDVDKMISGIINQLMHEAERRKISIYFVPSNIKISSIPLVKEVFYNIFLNAIIHSRCRNISICAKEEKKFCKITVEDDGIGIEPEIRKDIFKRTVKGGGGNGMGLYLSGKIVEMSGGRIKIKNRGGVKGTLFEIYLPHGK